MLCYVTPPPTTVSRCIVYARSFCHEARIYFSENASNLALRPSLHGSHKDAAAHFEIGAARHADDCRRLPEKASLPGLAEDRQKDLPGRRSGRGEMCAAALRTARIESRGAGGALPRTPRRKDAAGRRSTAPARCAAAGVSATPRCQQAWQPGRCLPVEQPGPVPGRGMDRCSPAPPRPRRRAHALAHAATTCSAQRRRRDCSVPTTAKGGAPGRPTTRRVRATRAHLARSLRK